MQIIIQPLPRIHLLNTQPGLPISQRRKKPEPPNQHRQNHPRRRPRRQQTLTRNAFPNRPAALLLLLLGTRFAVFDGEVGEVGGLDVEDEFDDGARDEGGGEVRGEVVVEEELTAHDEEGDVVCCPEEEEESGAVVEAVAGAYKVLDVAAYAHGLGCNLR